ncbi:MAG: hypothetical protein AB7P69_16180, partial [Candidatus Binatia bacterium]
MQDTASESFGNLPHDAAPFGTVPHPAETFGNVPHVTEKTEAHTLTVREAAKHFEAAGVARTERSIINWCNLCIPAMSSSQTRRRRAVTPSMANSVRVEAKASRSGATRRKLV